MPSNHPGEDLEPDGFASHHLAVHVEPHGGSRRHGGGRGLPGPDVGIPLVGPPERGEEHTSRGQGAGGPEDEHVQQPVVQDGPGRHGDAPACDPAVGGQDAVGLLFTDLGAREFDPHPVLAQAPQLGHRLDPVGQAAPPPLPLGRELPVDGTADPAHGSVQEVPLLPAREPRHVHGPGRPLAGQGRRVLQVQGDAQAPGQVVPGPQGQDSQLEPVQPIRQPVHRPVQRPLAPGHHQALRTLLHQRPGQRSDVPTFPGPPADLPIGCVQPPGQSTRHGPPPVRPAGARVQENGGLHGAGARRSTAISRRPRSGTQPAPPVASRRDAHRTQRGGRTPWRSAA
jgi:hypothetical protein